MARVKEPEPDVPAVVSVRRGDGAIVQMPRDEAVRQILLELVKPEGWAPGVAEQALHVPAVFTELERQRGAMPESEFLRRPRLQRIYSRLEALLAPESDFGGTAA